MNRLYDTSSNTVEEHECLGSELIQLWQAGVCRVPTVTKQHLAVLQVSVVFAPLLTDLTSRGMPMGCFCEHWSCHRPIANLWLVASLV